MVKTKRISVVCSHCKEKIELDLPLSLADDKEYYPFEYINIHGDPEHALMLFLDKNLVVRDSMVYADLNVAKEKGKELSALVRMSENEALASVYKDPLRYKILNILYEGPITEDNLIERLSNEKGFEESKFNSLMLPLTKTGIVKSAWLNTTFYECYFLLKDFVAFRIPSQITIEIINTNSIFKEIASHYNKNVAEFFQKNQQYYLLEEEFRIEEIQTCLEIYSEYKYEKILRTLSNGPKSSEDLDDTIEMNRLQELIDKHFILNFKVKSTEYYALLSNIRVKKFIPKFIVKSLSEKLKNKEITLEMATMHLDYLYELNMK